MKPLAAFFGFLFLILVITWIVQGNSFFMYKVFAPAEEGVRRDTFEQSKAYNQGMAQELNEMHIDYMKSTPDQQQAIAQTVIHRTADYDVTKLSPDLREWIAQLNHQQFNGN